jgi:putative Ca2+/H+ antiporter (TMEM165/GDT1 family)
MNITSPSIQQPLPLPQSNLTYIENEFQLEFHLSLLQSFFLTLIAELGDKTFIMLIILQLKTNKVTIFFSALFVLLSMNLLAMLIGYIIDYCLYKNIIDYISILFFFIYGAWMFGESLHTKEDSFQDELGIIEQKSTKIRTEKRSATVLAQQLQVIPEVVTFKDQYIASNANEPLLNFNEDEEDDDNDNDNDEYHPLHSNDTDKPLTSNRSNTVDIFKQLNDEPLYDSPNIDCEMFMTIAGTLALSECGDRTQFSSLVMAAVYDIKGVVCGSCLALFVTCFSGVYLGKTFGQYLHQKTLNSFLACLYMYYAIQIYYGK